MKDFKEIVYESPSEAQEMGKRDQWRESFQENVACAKLMKEQISEHYKNNSLNTQAVLENVVEQFGVERTKMILANSIDYFSNDGRISNQNKEWAKEVQIPDNGINHTHQYAIEQQGMIDMLARKMQAIEPELTQKMEQSNLIDITSISSSDLQKLMENDPKLAFNVQEAMDYMNINELLDQKLPQADLEYVNKVGELFREQEGVDKQYVFEFVAEALNHSDLQLDDLKMLDFGDFRSAFDDKDVNLLISNVELAYEQAEISKLNTPEALASIQEYFEEPISTEYLKNLNELANKTAMRSEENSPELIKEYLIDEIHEGKISFVDLYFLTPYDVEKAVNSHEGILVDREVQLENVVDKNKEAQEIMGNTPEKVEDTLSLDQVKELAQGKPHEEVTQEKPPDISALTTKELVEKMQENPDMARTIREANDISVVADGLHEPLPFEDMTKINDFATDIWLKYEDVTKVEVTDFIANAIGEGAIQVSDLENISRSEFFDCLTTDDVERLGEIAQEHREPEVPQFSFIDYENQPSPEEKLQLEASLTNIGYQVGNATLYFTKMDENDPTVQVGIFDHNFELVDITLLPDVTISQAVDSVQDMIGEAESLTNRTAPMIDTEQWLGMVEQAREQAANQDMAFQLGDYTLVVEKSPDIEGYVRGELFDSEYNSLFAVGEHNSSIAQFVVNYESMLSQDLLGDINPADLQLDTLKEATAPMIPVGSVRGMVEMKQRGEEQDLPQTITPVPDQENFYATTLTTQERVVIQEATEHAYDHWQDIPEEYRDVLQDVLAKIDPEMNLLDFYPEDDNFGDIEVLREEMTLYLTTEELLVIADVCEGASYDWEHIAENYRDTLDGVVDKITSVELERPDELDIEAYRYEQEFGVDEPDLDEMEENPDISVVKVGTREYHPTQENLEKLSVEGYAEIPYTDVTASGQEYTGSEDFSQERWDFIQQEPRMAGNYTITTSEIVGDVEVAMGENNHGFFATWVAYLEADQSKGIVDNWSHGHYFCDEDKAVNKEQAMADFSDRVKEHLPEKDKGKDTQESSEKPKKPSILQALKEEKEKSKAEKQKAKDTPEKTTSKPEKNSER